MACTRAAWCPNHEGHGQGLLAAAVQGRTATGPHSGQHDPRLGRGSRDEPFAKGKLCCDLDGFSLHAAVRIPQGLIERLEKLCRYAARPPLVLDRLSQEDDGTILYKLKRRYRSGAPAAPCAVGRVARRTSSSHRTR